MIDWVSILNLVLQIGDPPKKSVRTRLASEFGDKEVFDFHGGGWGVRVLEGTLLAIDAGFLAGSGGDLGDLGDAAGEAGRL